MHLCRVRFQCCAIGVRQDFGGGAGDAEVAYVEWAGAFVPARCRAKPNVYKQ
jgi:hypothetical protein